MNRKTIEQVKKIDILKVADAMHLEYTQRGKYRWTLCFMHEDRNPSLWLKVGANTWFCPVCGKGGDNIALVMAYKKMEFAEAVEWMMREFGIEETKTLTKTKTKTMKMTLDDTALREAYQRNNYSVESGFCKALVGSGILTLEQAARAAERYHLGKSKEGGVIYWMVDSDGTVLDGKVMFYNADCHRDHERKPFWVASWLVQQKRLAEKFSAGRCLFGLHLIGSMGRGTSSAVAIVESEKTAVICSEIFPDYIWMATGGKSNLTPAMLKPLKGRKVILFPDTDEDGETYRRWKDIAIEAGKMLEMGIMVSDVLERRATAAQKREKIDIADYLID